MFRAIMIAFGISIMAFISPAALTAYEKDANPENFIIFSPPKCGTHLAGKVLALMAKKEPIYQLENFKDSNEAVELVLKAAGQNSFVIAHSFNSKSLTKLVKKGYKVVFVIRDPRDQLISLMNWMREGQWQAIAASHITDVNEQIDELITGSRFGWRCFERCFAVHEYCVSGLHSKQVYYAYYENLVGPRGGGSQEQQITEILNLAAFLKIDLSLEEAEAIANNAYGNTLTFRSGKIGNWKNYFTEQHKQLYKSLYKKQLVRLGYEQDSNW